jgi:hypothetical protein
VSPESEWTPRKLVLRKGIYEISKDSEGRYHIAVPDGKRENGLTGSDLLDLIAALQGVTGEGKETGDS